MEWHYKQKDKSIDAVAQVIDHHVLVIVTAVIDGEREVVAIHAGQKPDDLDAHMDAVMDVVHRPDEVYPLGALVLRQAMFRDAMNYRRKALGESLPRKERRRRPDAAESSEVEHLEDALAYVFSLRNGNQPSLVIANRRGITRRTAEGRIVQARKRGYLSAAKGKTASGKLTEKAVAMAEERLTNGWVRKAALPIYEMAQVARQEGLVEE